MGPMLPHKSYEKRTSEIMWNCLDFSGCVRYNDVLTSEPQTNTHLPFLLSCPLTSYVLCRIGCAQIPDIVKAVLQRNVRSSTNKFCTFCFAVVFVYAGL
jgi:hypothetical protein